MNYMTREWFIQDMTGWSSYLPLLWKALEETEGEVIELGMGNISTPRLHEVCKDRKVYSYDSDIEWYRKFEYLRNAKHSIEYTQDWLEPIQRHRYTVGVLFSDEAPGFIRKYNIAMFAQNAKIIVFHDSELKSDHGYLFSLVRPLFKYVKEYEFEGVGATAVSNFIDVSLWKF